MMKLYVFDSCPYCVRVRMMLGLKGIPCEQVFFPAGQMPQSIRSRIQKQVVPVLELPAGAGAHSLILQESMDIIRFLDELNNKQLLDIRQPTQELVRWFKHHALVMDSLCYPRMPSLDLPELGTAEAMDFFIQSRAERLGMPLQQALASTSSLIDGIEPHLNKLVQLLDAERLLQQERVLTIDDFYAFPHLRNLAMVSELNLPDSIIHYLLAVSEQVNIPLYQPVGVDSYPF
ncbi:glutaredoxin 2 [Endozoicomonadaceae bacterium StTr2]